MEPAVTAEEANSLARRYVLIGEGGESRHLELLHGNFARWGNPKRSFLEALVRDSRQITDRALEVLLGLEWRCQITAAWMIGVDRRAQFRHRLADLLLASRFPYAGEGFCMAFVLLGTGDDAEILVDYLKRYLQRNDAHYEQPWAMGGLSYLDEVLATDYSAEFLEPDGLWERWAKGIYSAEEEKARIGRMHALVSNPHSPMDL